MSEPIICDVTCVRVSGSDKEYMKIEVDDKHGGRWIVELTMEDFAFAVTGRLSPGALTKKSMPICPTHLIRSEC